MLRKTNGNLEWLEFELLADTPNLKHAVFLRSGGVSKGKYGSLSVIYADGDLPENVVENRRRIQEALALDHLISSPLQVHEATISLVEKPLSPLPNCDGLVTQEKNMGIMAMHADCQASLFYDPIQRAIGTLHAGWRGQIREAYAEMVQKMRRCFGSKAENLLVCVSPSLGPENSEFKNFEAEWPEKYWKFQIAPTYFNMWEIARYQLETAGILPDHIQIASLDTFTNRDDFFSYRRERKESGVVGTGGHGTVIALTA
jgi:YfiH family protein